jgi:hypothetical protein
MTEDLSYFLETIKYTGKLDPRKLVENKIPIDKKIKDSVLKINQTNWVWTLWSCQGHNRGANKGCLSYYVFVVKKKYLSVLLEKIYNTSPKTATCEFPCHNGSYSYQLSAGYEDENFSVVSLHYHSSHGNLSLNRIQQSMNELAVSICEENYE